MVAVANITFNLNILFRFFLVLHADGFVKRGQLNLKLFRQLYWLAWTTFVTIEVIVFAAPPFSRETFSIQTRGAEYAQCSPTMVRSSWAMKRTL